MNYNELIIKELLEKNVTHPKELASIKRSFAKKNKINCPSNISLLKEYHKLVN